MLLIIRVGRIRIVTVKMNIEPHSIKDCYRCTECGTAVAHGDIYCRGCGIKFSSIHMGKMKKMFHIHPNILPWNIRDRYRCIKCERFVSIHDQYCRYCRKVFDKYTIDVMKNNMQNLVNMNFPSLVFLIVFVLAILFVLIASVR